jgi:protein-tyrosine-phosphatase
MAHKLRVLFLCTGNAARTVCDKAAETCPVFPGDPERIHWSFEDPTTLRDAGAQTRAFEHIATELAARMRIWMSLPDVRRRLDEEQDSRRVRTSHELQR